MSKKIYFCGSIRGGQQDVEIYARMISELKKYGTVLTEHIGTKGADEIENKHSAKFIHDRDVEWLQECDVVIAEVTQPSHGVGYEVGRATAMHKTILLLFRADSGKKLSCMISGVANGNNIILKNYTEEEIPDIFKNFLG